VSEFEKAFEKYMKAKELAEKRYGSFSAAREKEYDIKDLFPHCNNKLISYDGKLYVVTKSNSDFNYAEVEE